MKLDALHGIVLLVKLGHAKVNIAGHRQTRRFASSSMVVIALQGTERNRGVIEARLKSTGWGDQNFDGLRISSARFLVYLGCVFSIWVFICMELSVISDRRSYLLI